MAAERWTRESISWMFVEGSAIVLSILLAFSIDAWWDEKREEDDVQGMLVAVLEDLRNSREKLAYSRTLSDSREGAVVKLLEVSYGKDANVNGPSIDSLLRGLAWYHADFIVRDAGINSLIFSGTFGAIASDDLRSDLASWPAKKEYIHYIHDMHKQFLDDVWWPFMRDNAYQPQILRGEIYRLGHPNTALARFPVSPREQLDHGPLLNNKEFHNVLAQYWSIQIDILIAYQDTDKWLKTSIELLEEELEIEPRPGNLTFDADMKGDNP